MQSALVGTIAITVAAVVAASAVARGVFLRPLPFPDPSALHHVHALDSTGAPAWVSWPTFHELQERTELQDLAGYTVADFIVQDPTQGPESILAHLTTRGYLEVLGVMPVAGRGFRDADHAFGADHVALLTHEFWQRRYGSDPSIVGRRISLRGPEWLPGSDGEYLVIGILAREFWPFWSRLEVVVPFRPTPEYAVARETGVLENVVSRLHDDASADEARAEVLGTIQSLRAEHGRNEVIANARVIHAQDALFADYKPRLLLVLLSAGLMFVLALVNVGTMLGVRRMERARELSVRQALGARTRHLLRLATVESSVLGATGIALGLVFGMGGTALVRGIVPDDLLSRLPGEAGAIGVDSEILALVAGTALLCFAALGAVSAVRGDHRGGARPNVGLRAGLTRGEVEARSALLGTQLALAMALVAVAVVLSTSLARLRAVEVGIQPEGVQSAWLNLDPRRYATAASRVEYYDRVLAALGEIDGVATVGGVDLRFDLTWQRVPAVAEDPEGRMANHMVMLRSATPAYFATMGIPLLEGRLFSDADRAGAPDVALVSRTLAERIWPGLNPVGRVIRPSEATAGGPWLTVIGVVGDIRSAPQRPPSAMLYRPVRQAPPPWLYLMLKAGWNSRSLGADLRQAVWEIDAQQPLEGPRPVTDQILGQTAYLRFLALMGIAFGGLGVLIAVLGVHALTAHTVQRSIREIGVRKALGATAGGIARMLLKRSARLALPSGSLGLLLGLALLRVLGSEVEGVELPATWFLITSVAAFAALVAAATYVPSRRAAAVSPAAAIRAD